MESFSILIKNTYAIKKVYEFPKYCPLCGSPEIINKVYGIPFCATHFKDAKISVEFDFLHNSFFTILYGLAIFGTLILLPFLFISVDPFIPAIIFTVCIAIAYIVQVIRYYQSLTRSLNPNKDKFYFYLDKSRQIIHIESAIPEWNAFFRTKNQAILDSEEAERSKIQTKFEINRKKYRFYDIVAGLLIFPVTISVWFFGLGAVLLSTYLILMIGVLLIKIIEGIQQKD